MENLLVGLVIGVVVFIMYWSQYKKKREIKEKAEREEYTKRLEELTKTFEDTVTIKTMDEKNSNSNDGVDEEII